MRDFRFFALHDNSAFPVVEVKAIHDEKGYRNLRRMLAGRAVPTLRPVIPISRSSTPTCRAVAA